MEEKGLNQFVPAHRDISLTDRPGEVWKDVPGLEGYYFISNYGRVLRAERKSYDCLGRPYRKARQIILAGINRDRNLHLKDWSYRLQVTLTVQGDVHNLQVARIVYYQFVEHFDLKNPKLVISYKNNNGLEIYPENLELLDYHAKNQKSYYMGRQLSHFKTNPTKHLEIIAQNVQKSSKVVSKYNEDGKIVATLKSITDASKVEQVAYSKIVRALNHPEVMVNGFYWRRGNANRITRRDIDIIVRKKSIGYKAKRGIPVTQLSLNNEVLATYSAKSLAANITGIAHKQISSAISGKLTHGGGFYWKQGNLLEVDFTKKAYQISDALFNGQPLKISDLKDKNTRKKIPVTQFDRTGEPMAVYESVAEAASKTKIRHQYIYKSLFDIQGMAGGYYWRKGHIRKNIFEIA